VQRSSQELREQYNIQGALQIKEGFFTILHFIKTRGKQVKNETGPLKGILTHTKETRGRIVGGLSHNILY
jgi:hypothetical protein